MLRSIRVISARSCKGVNETLDAVIGPLNVTAGYVDRISKGDIPPKITDHYNGDFNDDQDQSEPVYRRGLSGLIQQMNYMSTQHDLGEIDLSSRLTNFQGAYRTMAEGLNNMVMGHISVKKKAMACLKRFGRRQLRRRTGKIPWQKSIHQRHN